MSNTSQIALDLNEIHTRLNWCNRAQLESILDNISIVCYPSESDQELKTAIIANLEDGTLSMDDIPEWK